MKKMVVAILAGTMLLSNGLQVSAAGLRDVFDANYYAEQYKDLKDAFGDNEDALYKHFVEYGLKEGRNMNPIIDIAKYRKQYEDLDKAFGDNWDAYVEHYFNYGVKENRDNGTNFDVKKYKEAYKDIQDAFGDDYKKIAKHYMEYGKKENRDKGNKEQIAKPANKPANKPVVQKPVSLERSERTDYPDGGWSIVDYDAKGYSVKTAYYKADGTLEFYLVYENDANGVRLKEFFHEASGELTTTAVYYYKADGKIDYTISTYAEGSYVQKFNEDETVGEITYYDAEGNFERREVNLFENGAWSGCITYDEAGNKLQEYKAVEGEDGSINLVPVEPEEELGFTGTQEAVREDGSKMVYEYVNGQMVKSSYFDASGALVDYATYIRDENGRELSYTAYDANGNVTAYVENKYNEAGDRIEAIVKSADGTISINQYDRVNGYQTVICYDANGTFLSHDVYKLDENMNPIERKSYDAEGNLIEEDILIEDADGNYTSVPKEA